MHDVQRDSLLYKKKKSSPYDRAAAHRTGRAHDHAPAHEDSDHDDHMHAYDATRESDHDHMHEHGTRAHSHQHKHAISGIDGHVHGDPHAHGGDHAHEHHAHDGHEHPHGHDHGDHQHAEPHGHTHAHEEDAYAGHASDQHAHTHAAGAFEDRAFVHVHDHGHSFYHSHHHSHHPEHTTLMHKVFNDPVRDWFAVACMAMLILAGYFKILPGYLSEGALLCAAVIGIFPIAKNALFDCISQRRPGFELLVAMLLLAGLVTGYFFEVACITLFLLAGSFTRLTFSWRND